MIWWILAGFVVGFLMFAAQFRELLFDKDVRLTAWLWCIGAGVFVAVFEYIVIITT